MHEKITRVHSIRPICNAFEIPTRTIGSFSKSCPPPLHPLHISLKPFFMPSKGFRKSFSLFPNIRGAHMIKYRKKSVAYGILTVHNLHKLIKAPSGRSITFGENHNGSPRSLNRIEKFSRDALPSRKLLVITKCANSKMHQGGVEVIREVLTGVFTSETKEDVVIPARRRR